MAHRWMAWRIVGCAAALIGGGCAGSGMLLRDSGGSGALFGQFKAFDGETGRELSFDQVMLRACGADVVLFGEEHSDVVCNALEAQVLAGLVASGRGTTLAMEFFENDTQAGLDAYLLGRISEAEFRKLTRQKKAYLLSHRPLIEFCKATWTPVIAANAPTRLTRALRLSGKTFDEFRATTQPADRALLPSQSELLEGPYHDRFVEAMSGHEMPASPPTSQPASQPASGSAEPTTSAPAASQPSKDEQVLRSYRAQSMWDDAMSESIANHRARFADRRVMLIVGEFHVEQNGGTQAKLRQRRPGDCVITIVYRGVSTTPFAFDPSDRGAGDVIVYGIKPPEDEKPAKPATSQPTSAPTSNPS